MLFGALGQLVNKNINGKEPVRNNYFIGIFA
ncbi:hypothetical protein CLV32_0034 [Pedobacter duraquae]|uniref:Uncharacterized protein n=1 Tax=Pedobacter duraquae TaxID=425511 RepID=A0A4R6IND0_9SPHI|nr:hypothetical protein CLV32_0034 [Pedobacter duraquae]